jgi:enoyl-CoA hydratase/carnithine racemase
MTDAVHARSAGRVTVLTINRPRVRNAIDADVSEGIGRMLTAAAADESVGAVVITGAGSQAFCAGMDLRSFATGRPIGPGIGTLLRDRYSKPLVAAVNGAAVGGGFDLALACDLVVAAEHATFGLPEVKRGVPSVGGATRLAQRLPLALALELTLTGEPIDAQRALGLGLVNRVVPGDSVVDEAVRLAGLIAANAPLAVAFTRTLVQDVAGSLDAPAWAERQASAGPILRSDDARIGAEAFAARQVPTWTGR